MTTSFLAFVQSNHKELNEHFFTHTIKNERIKLDETIKLLDDICFLIYKQFSK